MRPMRMARCTARRAMLRPIEPCTARSMNSAAPSASRMIRRRAMVRSSWGWMMLTRPSTAPSAAVATAAPRTPTHCGCEGRDLPFSSGSVRAPTSSIRTALVRTVRALRIIDEWSVRAHVHAWVWPYLHVASLPSMACVHGRMRACSYRCYDAQVHVRIPDAVGCVCFSQQYRVATRPSSGMARACIAARGRWVDATEG